MENKNNIYKAIVGYLKYYEDLKGILSRVMLLYNLDGEVVEAFEADKYPSALLEGSDSAGEKGILPKGVNKSDFYEVLVEDVNPKEPLKKFKITSVDSFTPACLLYNAKWIRKKDNLFISTNGIVQNCKKLGYFIPIDKEESFIYSRVILDGENKFFAEDGIIKKYRVENFDFLKSAAELRKNNLYVMSKAVFDSIETWLIEEIDFISKEKLKEWFVKSTEVDIEEISNAINKINDEGLDATTFKIRVERCRRMFESFAFSKDDISWFFSRKKFKKQLDDYQRNKEHEIDVELDIEKKRKFGNIEAELEEKLDLVRLKVVEKEDLLRKREVELNASEIDLENVKKEIEVQKQNLSVVSNEITHMENAKTLIVETLKETVKNQQPISFKREENVEPLVNDVVFFERGKGISELEDDNYRALFPSDLDKEQRKAFADILIHRASIIPDVSYAYTLANFVTNTYINIITVEHGWYHYEDFVKAGILDFYNSALTDKEHNYLLVLENINIVPIECAIKPFVDLLKGTRLNLPGAKELAFPKNLRILATVLPSASDEAYGIKLNEDSYSGFNFVETPRSRLSMALDRIMNTAQRYYVNLESVTIEDLDDDNGYSRYKDY